MPSLAGGLLAVRRNRAKMPRSGEAYSAARTAVPVAMPNCFAMTRQGTP
jgi:hypothetical protein